MTAWAILTGRHWAALSVSLGATLVPAAAQSPANPILDEATLQREYQDYRASVHGMRRYHVRYILVADEALARDLIARIRSGARFEELARRHSTHEQSAANGGDLGAHPSCRWAKTTLAMLDTLKRGQVWPKPVKGTHGWGIYRLESVVDIEPRSFTEYRTELLSGKFEPECPWEPPVTVRTAPAPGPAPGPVLSPLPAPTPTPTPAPSPSRAPAPVPR